MPEDVHDFSKKPWWNDGDKVGGAFATLVMLSVGVILLAGAVRLAVWIWP